MNESPADLANDPGKRPGDRVGRTGVERARDRALRGTLATPSWPRRAGRRARGARGRSAHRRTRRDADPRHGSRARAGRGLRPPRPAQRRRGADRRAHRPRARDDVTPAFDPNLLDRGVAVPAAGSEPTARSWRRRSRARRSSPSRRWRRSRPIAPRPSIRSSAGLLPPRSPPFSLHPRPWSARSGSCPRRELLGVVLRSGRAPRARRHRRRGRVRARRARRHRDRPRARGARADPRLATNASAGHLFAGHGLVAAIGQGRCGSRPSSSRWPMRRSPAAARCDAADRRERRGGAVTAGRRSSRGSRACSRRCAPAWAPWRRCRQRGRHRCQLRFPRFHPGAQGDDEEGGRPRPTTIRGEFIRCPQ